MYLRIESFGDICGGRNCNLTYAISLLCAQNQFDLQVYAFYLCFFLHLLIIKSLMLQDGKMLKRSKTSFEENTVIRLMPDLLQNNSSKLYLGLMLFDVPSNIQG